MKKAITTGALICALAVGMTGKPNEAPAKIQQSLNPQGPSSLTIHNEKRTICYAGHSDDNPTNWQTAVKRPDWWLVFIAALTGFVIYLQAREMTRATKEMQASTDVAKKTLVLTQRPRIAVRAF